MKSSLATKSIHDKFLSHHLLLQVDKFLKEGRKRRRKENEKKISKLNEKVKAIFYSGPFKVSKIQKEVSKISKERKNSCEKERKRIVMTVSSFSLNPASSSQSTNPVTTTSQSTNPVTTTTNSSLSSQSSVVTVVTQPAHNHQQLSSNQITIPINQNNHSLINDSLINQDGSLINDSLTNQNFSLINQNDSLITSSQSQSINVSNVSTPSTAVPATVTPTMHHQTVSTVTRPVPGHRSASYQNAVSVFSHHFNRPSLPPPHSSQAHRAHTQHAHHNFHSNQIRMTSTNARSRPAPRPPQLMNPNHSTNYSSTNYSSANYSSANYSTANYRTPPPPVPPFPRVMNVPMNHPLAIHSHPNLLQEAINSCLISIPLPPPPYSTLPNRGNRPRTGLGSVSGQDGNCHNTVTTSLSAPITSCQLSQSSNERSSNDTSPNGQSSNNGQTRSSGQSTCNQSSSSSPLSYIPSFLRSLTTSIVNSGSTSNNNGNNNSNNGSASRSINNGNSNSNNCSSNNNGYQCPVTTTISQSVTGHTSVNGRESSNTGHSQNSGGHSQNSGGHSQNSGGHSSGTTVAGVTSTGHRPLPPVLPSYHHLYASSSPSSIRRRRRRMRHSRIVEDDGSHSTYLTENRKQFICISLLVVGSILAFIGLVTVSLFAISFGLTFGLFSFILYRLLPTSKYSPGIMRNTQTLSHPIHPYPYLITNGTHTPDSSTTHFPPPPPSYQEAIAASSHSGTLLQLNPTGLIAISGHQNVSNYQNVSNSTGHANQGFDSSPAIVQHHLVHHHHRQESSISSNSSHGNQDLNVSTGVTVVNVESGTVVGSGTRNSIAIESCPKSVIAVQSGFTDSDHLIDHSIDDHIDVVSIHHSTQDSKSSSGTERIDSKSSSGTERGHSKVNGPKNSLGFGKQGMDGLGVTSDRSSVKSGMMMSIKSDSDGDKLSRSGQSADHDGNQLSGNGNNSINNGTSNDCSTRSTNRCQQSPQFITIIEATI